MHLASGVFVVSCFCYCLVIITITITITTYNLIGISVDQAEERRVKNEGRRAKDEG